MAETLKNGATVLWKVKDIVLAQWGNEFVVWRVDHEGNAFWGAYSGNRELAERRFKERLQLLYPPKNMPNKVVGDEEGAS
jgi:hypothetical protein